MSPAKILKLLFRAYRLRCPACGKGKLFAGFFRMHSKCSACNVSYEREPGFFLGAIYFNYGLTAIIATAGYMMLTFGGYLSNNQSLVVTVVFAILFPIVYFRHARSMWMAFDQLIDPR